MNTQEIIKGIQSEINELRAANEKIMGIIAHRVVNYWGYQMTEEKRTYLAEKEENDRKIDLYTTAILALREI